MPPMSRRKRAVSWRSAPRSERRLGCTVMQSVLLVRETVSRGESSRLDAVIPAIRRGPTKAESSKCVNAGVRRVNDGSVPEWNLWSLYPARALRITGSIFEV